MMIQSFSSPKSALACVCVLGFVGAAAQEAPRFTGIEAFSNNEIRLKLSGTRGENYRIETSTDLLGWTAWITQLSVGADQHTDAAAPLFHSRFYRLIPLDGSDVFTGDHLATDSGDVVFHPVNHASFVMRWNGKWIYNDPVGGSGPYRGIPSADLILVSHTHGDHYDASTLSSIKSADTVLIAPQSVVNGMPASLKRGATVLANGESVDVIGITVEAVPAYNSRHPKGSGNGYVLNIGGKRIYMSGDTEDVAEMRALKDIEVAFLCMNVPFTMTITAAASAVREFQPRIVYPYHYRNQDSTYANLETFKELVGKEGGTEVRARKWY